MVMTSVGRWTVEIEVERRLEGAADTAECWIEICGEEFLEGVCCLGGWMVGWERWGLLHGVLSGWWDLWVCVGMM